MTRMLASTIRLATSWAEEAGVAMMPMISSASATLFSSSSMCLTTTLPTVRPILSGSLSKTSWMTKPRLGRMVLAAMALPRLPAPTGEADRVQVPPDLYRVYAGEVPELLARDRVATLLDELLGGPEILGEPVGQAGL